MTQKPKGKGSEVLAAIRDFVIICLLVVAAGGGGYYWGIHQQLAPIQKVGPGTPGAISISTPTSMPPPASKSPATSTSPATPSGSSASTGAADSGKHRYWISSSGSDYIGYSITAKVNDTPVDNFFGPGKNVDITRLVKSGQNDVVFEAKALGSDYNKHGGDKAAVLTVQVVGGPEIKENFKSSDVIATYKRSATDEGDSSETFHFTGE